MVLEAVPGSSAAIRVDDAEYRATDVELADGDAEVLGASLAELVAAEGSQPDHLVLVVPGDLDEHRFAVLTEAVSLAGLPDPSWLPDAVAWAGDQLARSARGRLRSSSTPGATSSPCGRCAPPTTGSRSPRAARST